MNKITAAATFAFVLLSPARSDASIHINGHMLLDMCSASLEITDPAKARTDSTSALNAGYCIGLMQGLIDATQSYELSKKIGYICLPAPIPPKNHEAAAIVVKYLRAHPSDLNTYGPALAIRALKDAYPCKERS